MTQEPPVNRRTTTTKEMMEAPIPHLAPMKSLKNTATCGTVRQAHATPVKSLPFTQERVVRPRPGYLDTTEQWFLFWDRDTYCIEEFGLGPTSAYDPASFRCTGCKEIYQVEWDMTTDNACGLSWGSVFVDDSDIDSPFSGFLMFDTHNAFGDRNEDNGMLVVSAAVMEGNTCPIQIRKGNRQSFF